MADQNIFRDSTDVKQLLAELAGFASVCWQQDKDNNRVFDSERASLAVDHAYSRLNELIKENN